MPCTATFTYHELEAEKRSPVRYEFTHEASRQADGADLEQALASPRFKPTRDAVQDVERYYHGRTLRVTNARPATKANVTGFLATIAAPDNAAAIEAAYADYCRRRTPPESMGYRRGNHGNFRQLPSVDRHRCLPARRRTSLSDGVRRVRLRSAQAPVNGVPERLSYIPDATNAPSRSSPRAIFFIFPDAESVGANATEGRFTLAAILAYARN